MRARVSRYFERVWYGEASGFFLLPFAWLYRGLTASRRFLYQRGVFRSVSVGVPVIVVGNITAGGTGKTPLVIWLVNYLQRRGLSVAVVSRGYGRDDQQDLRVVSADSDAALCGDEPVLIAKRTGAPVIVCANRVAAGERAVADGAAIVICDDGLQHYRLERDLELLVVDGQRGFGNGRMLPAGPLREPVSRLKSVDLVIGNGALPKVGVRAVKYSLQQAPLRKLGSEEEKPLRDLKGQRVLAAAAIGNPQRFFDTLSQAGLEVEPLWMDDHAAQAGYDFSRADGRAIIVTEKDAVKLTVDAALDIWVLPVDVTFSAEDEQLVLEKLSHLL